MPRAPVPHWRTRVCTRPGNASQVCAKGPDPGLAAPPHARSHNYKLATAVPAAKARGALQTRHTLGAMQAGGTPGRAPKAGGPPGSDSGVYAASPVVCCCCGGGGCCGRAAACVPPGGVRLGRGGNAVGRGGSMTRARQNWDMLRAAAAAASAAASTAKGGPACVTQAVRSAQWVRVDAARGMRPQRRLCVYAARGPVVQPAWSPGVEARSWATPHQRARAAEGCAHAPCCSAGRRPQRPQRLVGGSGGQ